MNKKNKYNYKKCHFDIRNHIQRHLIESVNFQKVQKIKKRVTQKY